MTPEVHPEPTTGPDPAKVAGPFRPEEHGFPPPLTRSQGEARRRADLVIDAKYPGQLIAYVDTWAGDELSRDVVVAADTPAEFHRQLAALPPAVRDRVDMTQVPGPDVIDYPDDARI